MQLEVSINGDQQNLRQGIVLDCTVSFPHGAGFSDLVAELKLMDEMQGIGGILAYCTDQQHSSTVPAM